MARKSTPTTYPTVRIPAVSKPLMEAASCIGTVWRSGLLGDRNELEPSIQTAQELTLTARRAGVDDFAELTGALARNVVATVAGVPQLGATLTDEEKAKVRRVRNTFIAAQATLPLTTPRDQWGEPLTDLPRSPYARKANESCRYPRPWTVDEILLARIHFWTDTRPSSLRPGIAYALVEAGATPRDASAALDTDLIDDHGNPAPETPTTVKVHARARRGYRELKLTAFGAALVARNLDLMKQYELPARERLTFTGAKPGSGDAGMSVQLYLNKHTAWAGVDDSTTNVSGIALWRQLQLLSTAGMTSALNCAFGRKSQFTTVQRARQKDRLLDRMFTDQDTLRSWID
ncbi:MAG TPA: hypothetical protein VFX60_13300 [Micromonospora sp.]|nr:hypothetical protein [Micromonospora sp.]